MNLGKHAKTLTIILILMTTGLAGCLGDGETEDVEQKTINIAGSSTVFPVASAWGQAYSTANAVLSIDISHYHILHNPTSTVPAWPHNRTLMCTCMISCEGFLTYSELKSSR